MRWFRRIAQGLSWHGGWPRRIGKTELRRSNIFIDNPPPDKRQLRRSDIFIDNRSPNRRELRRSGISRRVGGPGICKPLMVRCDRSDVAPTELDTIFLCHCYKDVAPTELGAIYRLWCYKDFAPTELFLTKKSSPQGSKKGFLRSSQT